MIDQPLVENEAGGVDYMSREDAYVDLAVLSSYAVDLEWSNSDRDTIMKMRHLEQESIGIDDIWKPTDQLVIARGIAGIGKSTLIKRYILKWAKDQILNGLAECGKIDFLFFFECRELNTTPNLNSFEDLIKAKYPNIFQYLKFSDLEIIADRIMLIVDGLDELQGIYDDAFHTAFPTINVVKKMIDTKSDLLKGHKTIACGRPKACELVKSQVQVQKVKRIEVCGFNERKTTEYIDHFFQDDLERAEKVKAIIERPNIKVMSSVPVFLWIICLLYSEDFDEEINTTTELYTYALFTFLKKHLRGCKSLEHKSLIELVDSKEFGEIVLLLSKLSTKTYMQHQVVFTDAEIKDIKFPVNLEQTGLVTKHSLGKFGRQIYQFKHLAYQEFLCSLNLCLEKGVSEYKMSRELSSCTPTILGLHHLIEESNNPLFIAFFQRLKKVQKDSRTLKESKTASENDLSFSNFIGGHIKRICEVVDKNVIVRRAGEKAQFFCNSQNYEMMDLIKNFRENSWLFSKNHLTKITKSEMVLNISSRHSFEILEFVKVLKLSQIFELQIDVEDKLFKKADLELCAMVKKNISSHLAINFYDMHVMSIYFSNIYAINVPVELKFNKLPDEIKESFDSFFVQKFSGVSPVTEDKVFENMLYLLADLTKHVLESERDKKLMIVKRGNPIIFDRLEIEIRKTFGQIERFDDKIWF